MNSFGEQQPLSSLKVIYRKSRFVRGVFRGNFNAQYMAKVNVPCKKCHTLIKVGVAEKTVTCPVCATSW